jgi:hypothetical protein
MLQRTRRSYSLLRIERQQLRHEIYSIRSYVFPLFFICPELTFFDLLYYLIVIRSIKWRISAQQNIHDDSNAPQIAFLIVIITEHLRGDVVRCSKLLVHFLVVVEYA